MRPRGQRWLPGYEGLDAGSGHLGWQLGRHPTGVPEQAGLESVVAVLCVVAQTVWRLRGEALFAPRAPGASRGHRPVQSDAEFVALESVLRAARQAASLRRLAGAETALFH